MRTAVVVVVLAIHVVFYLLFTVFRGPSRGASDDERAPAIAFLLAPSVASATLPVRRGRPRAMPPKAPRRAGPAAESPAAPVLPEPPPESTTPAAAPDWRSEMEIAANNQIENEARKARQPSVLAPHDFSKVKPGSTDDARRKFGWSHAATHRVEEIPTGGLLININDRCAVVWAVLPLALCRIGKIPARGDLFDHMKDSAPEAYP